jgi:hypothetical protein
MGLWERIDWCQVATVKAVASHRTPKGPPERRPEPKTQEGGLKPPLQGQAKARETRTLKIVGCGTQVQFTLNISAKIKFLVGRDFFLEVGLGSGIAGDVRVCVGRRSNTLSEGSGLPRPYRSGKSVSGGRP